MELACGVALSLEGTPFSHGGNPRGNRASPKKITNLKTTLSNTNVERGARYATPATILNGK